MNGADIDNYNFHQKPSKRILFDNLELEERLACQWSGYTWSQYLELPGADRWIDPENPSDSKAKVLATYRRYKQLEAVMHDYKPRK